MGRIRSELRVNAFAIRSSEFWLPRKVRQCRNFLLDAERESPGPFVEVQPRRDDEEEMGVRGKPLTPLILGVIASSSNTISHGHRTTLTRCRGGYWTAKRD
jgi:hypothetical protein